MSSPPEDTDYRKYVEGKEEPYHGKVIKHLIQKHRDFVVYLDDELYVWWAIRDTYRPDWVNSPSFGEVLNRVSFLEAVETSDIPQRQVTAFRRMLGEAVARLLDSQSVEQANKILDNATDYIIARNSESSRLWYLSASLATTAVVVLVILLLWTFRRYTPLNPEGLNVLVGSGAGALGAFLSILLRSQTVPLDSSAGKKVYYFEGTAKILAGMIGAVLVAVSIEGKFLFGNISNPENQLQVITALCIVAGASERLVPSLIKKVETTNTPQAIEPHQTVKEIKK